MSPFKVAVLGGDNREIHVADLLRKEGHDVGIFGADAEALDGMSNASSAAEAVRDCEWIVCPAPGLGENDELYSPNASSPILLNEPLLELSAASNGGLVIGKASPTLGAVSERLGISVYEMKEDRALAVVVGAAVAEALIAELVGATSRIFRELRTLVLGYGATGSAIADALVALGCHTTVASRSRVNFEVARRRGAQSVLFDEWPDAVQPTDVVVNTVPRSDAIGNDVLPALVGKTVVDITSPPGGLDHDKGREWGVEVIWARGLAGRRAPLTIGEAQFEFIRRVMAARQASTDEGET